ncbi:hypothetical protein ACFFV7_09945 [Nonomuraea spiralis]|uniref:Uncharacterized protein n=1 Tax=Nonomuraea spiralis TaxID=46182 RepID=A0ABV5IBL3_9ACTN|nr:hypothetical protein [Nonomuraea spiralis]GGT04295.1 hypothetical protein GCM10010176_055680 [Nonomuraea spiralis]
MSTDESPTARESRVAISEDWAATAVGLILLVLVLTGVVPVGLVP